MQINFIEKGNGYPQANDILVSHEDQTAYRVLPSRSGTGDGTIVAQQFQANECTLHVEPVDYEEYFNSETAWEI